MDLHTRSRLARTGLALMLATTAVGSSGCFGRFSLTRKLYAWNDSIGNKFVKNLAYWGLNIVLIYELVAAGDALVLNVVEFWTGSNPVADAGAVQMRDVGDGSLEIVASGETYVLVPDSATTFEVSRNGENVGRAEIRDESTLALNTIHGTKILRRGEKPALAQ